MNSYVAHLKNKYPGAEVNASANAIDVRVAGKHKIAMRSNAHGQLVDVSEEQGCEDRFDLSPIPRDSRVWKIDKKSGHVVRDEKAEERARLAKNFMIGDKVLSIKELQEEHDFVFSKDDGSVVKGSLKKDHEEKKK